MIEIAPAGKKSCHGYIAIAGTASLLKTPQLAIGALTPSPTNDKNASVNIAPGTENVSVTITAPIALGIMWRNKILADEAPATLAAVTNSSFFSLMTSARTILAIGAQ